jgi:threonine synthase
MRYVATRAEGDPGVSFETALFEGLPSHGGLYVPQAVEPWNLEDLARLSERTLTEIALQVLRPYVRGVVDAATLEAVVVEALNFPIPIVEVEPCIYSVELFHGPTLAFKDVGARVMARLMASLHHADDPLTVLAATSGDTGSAVAYAFHRVPRTRVVILYPDGRVSPTQEAQLTVFNGQRGNVRAYAVSGSFDDCHRLTREMFGDAHVRQRMRITSANSLNVGRLLPQMVYYFHAVGQVLARAAGNGVVCSTPSGNFGNLTAGLMAKRSGLPIVQFVAATNVNDVVPTYLETGHFEPRASVQTLANAMDVGSPSNFERMRWLYGDDLEGMRRDIVGCRQTDDEVRKTILRVYEERGYLLDPHSAIAYAGLKAILGQGRSACGSREAAGPPARSAAMGCQKRSRRASASGGGAPRAVIGEDTGFFLATAHPAKFAEIVEPIIGRSIDKPEPLANALSRPRHIIRIPATPDAVRAVLEES